MSTNKNVLSPLQHVPIADGSGNIAPHPHYSSSTHMNSHTLPTHSVLFLSLLIQTIFAMGRCCNLSTRSTRRNPQHLSPSHSVVLLSLLIQTIFAMGRCCNLSTRSTRRNPQHLSPSTVNR